MGNLPDERKYCDKRLKYVKYVLVAAVVVTAVIALRLQRTGSGPAEPDSPPAVRIGVTEGIPSVIIKEIERNHGSQSIEYADMKTYNFQDC